MPRFYPNNKLSLSELDASLALAFQRDCENLLEKYENLQTYDYTKFAKLWREMSFTLVFGVQECYSLINSFVDNCFYIIKKFIMFPKSTYTQVGAFYLMYGIFYKQPVDKWIKIRITPDELKQITLFIEQMKEIMQKEVLFVLAKLLQDDAFSLVFTLKQKGFEVSKRNSFDSYADDTFQKKNSETALQKFDELYIFNDVFKQYEETNKQYQEAIAQCPEACKGFMEDDADLMASITKTYNNIHSFISSNPSKQDDNSEEKSILSRRSNIKQKAFTSHNRKTHEFNIYHKLKEIANTSSVKPVDNEPISDEEQEESLVEETGLDDNDLETADIKSIRMQDNDCSTSGNVKSFIKSERGEDTKGSLPSLSSAK